MKNDTPTDAVGHRTSWRMLCKQLRDDYRFYSGAFRSDGKPKKNLLSRLWVTSIRVGFWVVASYRIRHVLANRRRPLYFIGDLIAFLSKLMTGCYISPHCSIGSEFSLPHPVAIVIGDGVVIKDRVRIYQGVTLGSSDLGRGKYPTIGNDVVIFANAVVVGDVTVEEKATIGAGAVVLQNVPAAHLAVGNPASIKPRRSIS